MIIGLKLMNNAYAEDKSYGARVQPGTYASLIRALQQEAVMA